MDNDPALEEDRRGKKLRNQLIRLISQLVFFLVGFMVCCLVFAALSALLSKTTMTLQAEPGETSLIGLPVLYTGFHFWIGEREIQDVSFDVNLEDTGSVEFVCRNDAFTVQPRNFDFSIYDPSQPYSQIVLTNECTEKVTIEMCWLFRGWLGC